MAGNTNSAAPESTKPKALKTVKLEIGLHTQLKHRVNDIIDDCANACRGVPGSPIELTLMASHVDNYNLGRSELEQAFTRNFKDRYKINYEVIGK